MNPAIIVVVIIAGIIILITLLASVHVQPAIRRPGLTLVWPIVDRLRSVNMQITTMSVPGQDGITRDNVSVRVDAVVYFRVGHNLPYPGFDTPA
ncbi:hypothetical protein GCM10023322_32520 [Rugosimonospora acidiphila]|uniref:Band 7 domain-containing protein n=1 Tax=Rugosimonospora acidiphila TaxID=556531 RepID=A0ABP9RTR0_9ACTN